MIFKGWKWYQYLIYFYCWLVIIIFTLVPIIFFRWWVWVLTIFAIFYVLWRVYMWSHRRQFLWRILGRSIFFAGPRSSGKGATIALGVKAMESFWLMKRKAPLSSIAINNSIVVNPYYYFESIGYTFKDMLWGWSPNRKIAIKNDDWEGRDYLLLDGGIYYPSHEDKDLTTMFPATPNFIATMGHSYAANLWTDSQMMMRLWIKLREQVADGYVLADYTQFGSRREFAQRIYDSIPWVRRHLIIHIRYYSMLESFEKRMLPWVKPGIADVAMGPLHVGAGYSNIKLFEAANGVVRSYSLLVKRKWLRYDSRVFHELFFGHKSPGSKH